MNNFLGIDWGVSKVGLAVADSETRMAFAREIISNDNKLLENIAKLIKEEEIGTVIIGVPGHDKYKDRPEKEREFGEEIRKKCGVDVKYQNEMFTTRMALSNLAERGKKGIMKKDDSESARIILQEWLDNEGLS